MQPQEKIITRKFLFLILGWDTERMKANNTNGSTMLHLTKEGIEKHLIPIPALNEQKSIVKAIEEEMDLVSANKRLIEIFEQKIKTKIGEVWGVKTIRN